jgi:hypothetical protein
MLRRIEIVSILACVCFMLQRLMLTSTYFILNITELSNS